VVLLAPTDAVLDEDVVVQPDLLFVRNERVAADPANRAIEVLVLEDGDYRLASFRERVPLRDSMHTPARSPHSVMSLLNQGPGWLDHRAAAASLVPTAGDLSTFPGRTPPRRECVR
jgi:hypothetical protein